MSEIKLTQLYDKDGNVLFPNMRLKTINNTSLFAEYEMGDERNNLNIDGKDGSDFLFVYCLTKDYSMPTQPDRGDNFVSSKSKGEWSDNPKGVDVVWKYEWVSISVKRAGTDYYSKFTSPILWAKWGDNGISSRTVFAYRSMNNPNEVPLTPEGGSVDFENNSIEYPKDASGNQWGPNENLDGIVWLSQKDFHSDGKQDALWTPPIRITGNEGLGIEFIYQLCKSESDVANVSLPSSDASIGYPNDASKEGSIWTKYAQGIDETYKIEVCSQRTKSEKDGWSEWSKPFIWSKWGEDGIDGDGVEYIYKISSITNGSYDEVDYPVASENYEIYKDIIQEDDFCPNESWLEKYANEHEGVDYENIKSLDTNWYDSPKDIGPSEPVEYVSIRKKKDGVWGEFSKPTIWNVWRRDGYDTYTEFLFTSIPSNDTLKDCTVSGGDYKNPKQNLTTTNSKNEVKDVSWSDTLPDYVDGNSIWMISSFFTSNADHENYNANWSAPSKMTDSQTLQVEYSNTENIDASNINQLQDIWENNSSLGISELETKFRELESSRGVVWGDENIVSPTWMATSRLMDGKWSKWVVSKIKGEKGVSSLYVSMSNDVDQVYVTNGVVEYEQNIKTTLNVWDGIEDVTQDSIVSSTYEDASIIYNKINKSYDLSVIFDVSKSITDDSISIPIEIDYGGRKIEKVFKVLVLNGNIDYDLVVSPLVIKRDGDGDLIDSRAKIEVNIKKAEIGNYTWQNGFCEIIPNGYKINFITGDGRMNTYSQGTSLPLTISDDLKENYKYVKTFTFLLFKEENDEDKLVDKEIVEVVSNGETLKIKEKNIQYGTSSSYKTEPTSWVNTIPNVSQGDYLWVKTTIIYEDDSDYSYTTYTRQGKDGSKGDTGATGATGSTIRGPRNWSDISNDTPIYSGEDDGKVEQWIDIVRDNDGSLYRCIKTHTKSNSISLSNTTYFEKSTDFDFVATKLLLANNASIDFLSGSSIILKDTSGDVTAGVQGGDGISFWAGGKTPDDASFNVSYDGAIKATSGTIGIFLINDESVTFDDGVKTERTFGEGVMFAAGDGMTTFYTSGGINMYSIMPPFNSSNISNLKNSKKIIIDNSVGVHIDKHNIEVNTANIEVNNTNILINDGSSINNIVITPNLAHIKFAFKTDSSTKVFTKNTSNKKWQINGVDTSINTSYGYVNIYNKEWFICDESTYISSSVRYKTGVKTSDYTENDGVIYFEI